MTNHRALIEFVIETAPSAPVSRRVAVYRGLAEICGDAEEAKDLNALANDLEAAELRCREFAFHFAQKR